MQEGKFNVVLDGFWGSSGKGKVATWLADRFNVTKVSSSNYPNAGHTARFEDGTSFVAKAIPTAAILKKVKGMGMECFLSPGSGFLWDRFVQEWEEAGQPKIYIHGRSSIVTPDHARREREGHDSTKHLASTMQGSGAALSDKIMRRADCVLAWDSEEMMREAFAGKDCGDKVAIIDPATFREMTWSAIKSGHTWLHEGSQGFALSIDHGSHYPFCTSRNCTLQSAMDQMAVPPADVGDVYLNLRTFPIRVGNVVEDGKRMGYSGDFYPDCKELSWEQIAAEAGMPTAEATSLTERERTTVTKRIRRVCNFSFHGLKDAVRVNGATKLILNFVQYLDWKDAGLKGGPEVFTELSSKTRALIDRIEDVTGLPVVLIGTGPLNDEVIARY
jgi:adenylosuccinate synthase